MAVFYFAAGIVHLVVPDSFLPIVPNFVPMAREVVLATGMYEIVGSLALPTVRLRWLAMLALYAVCVFPANVKHAVEGIHLSPIPDSWWYHGPLFLMQPVLAWWALFCSSVVDWPWREPPNRPESRHAPNSCDDKPTSVRGTDSGAFAYLETGRLPQPTANVD